MASLERGESVVGSYKEISRFLIDGFERLGIGLEFAEAEKNDGGMLTKKNDKKMDKKGHREGDKKRDYCMLVSSGADLSYEGKKLVGSAQFRKEGYILQHGSILFDYSRELIEEIFAETEKFKTDEKFLICLNEINPEITCEMVISALNSAFTVNSAN